MNPSISRRAELLALGLAAAGSLGSIFLSVGLGLKACPLCFYQRSFALAVLAILLLARVVRTRVGPDLACLLALPCAVAGLAVAGFHVSLELRGLLECPKGLFGLGSAPQQSLTLSVLLTPALGAGAAAPSEARGRSFGAAIALGALTAWGCIASAPPLPKPTNRPTLAEGYVLTMCEPPPARQQ